MSIPIFGTIKDESCEAFLVSIPNQWFPFRMPLNQMSMALKRKREFTSKYEIPTDTSDSFMKGYDSHYVVAAPFDKRDIKSIHFWFDQGDKK